MGLGFSGVCAFVRTSLYFQLRDVETCSDKICRGVSAGKKSTESDVTLSTIALTEPTDYFEIVTLTRY